MSKKKTENNMQPEEKVVTRYDRKMQKRAEEKKAAQREKLITNTVAIVFAILIVALAASFPIRSYLAINEVVCNIGGEEIKRVDFDYSYYVTVNNYVNSYGAYLSYFGLDTTKDLDSQIYSGTLTWKDYFEEMTVENLRRNKALKADAKANGFTYDTSAGFARFEEQVRESAKADKTSVSDYMKNTYGPYASLSRVKDCVEEALYVTAYSTKLNKDMTPDEEAVMEVYNEDPDAYDYVDYIMVQTAAELPTEPTGLADPGATVEEGQEYVPSEAEVKKAMTDAKKIAEAAKSNLESEGIPMGSMGYYSVDGAIRDWLFDESRKSGDITVIEDEDNNQYFTVRFEKRYLDEEATADVRVLIGESEEEAKKMYDTWKTGSADEDSFIGLCEGEYYDNAAGEGGLVEGISAMDDIYPELIDWLFAQERKVGDCDVVATEEGIGLVVFYSGIGKPQWYNEIKSDQASQALNDYTDALKEKVEVVDAGNKLKYIAKREAEKAAEEEESTETNDAAEDSDMEDSAE